MKVTLVTIAPRGTNAPLAHSTHTNTVCATCCMQRGRNEGCLWGNLGGNANEKGKGNVVWNIKEKANIFFPRTHTQHEKTQSLGVLKHQPHNIYHPLPVCMFQQRLLRLIFCLF